MVGVIVVEISPNSVRECVEREICSQSGNVDTLQILRNMRRSGELNAREAVHLDHLEHGVDQSSRLLFHTLSAILESRHQHLDHDCVKCGLSRHRGATLESLAEYLYKEDSHSKDAVMAKLRADPVARQEAIASLGEKLLESSRNAGDLTEITRILATDPKNSRFRDFIDTAVDYMRRLKESATALFRDITRSRRAHDELVSFTDYYSSDQESRRTNDHGGTFRLKGESTDHEGRKTKPEEQAAKVIEHMADGKRIAELRKKLERLIDEAMRAHHIALEGPKDQREAAAIKRNQDQAEAGKVSSDLKDAEAGERWFDA